MSSDTPGGFLIQEETVVATAAMQNKESKLETKMNKGMDAEKGMIFLENHHPIIVETLSELLGPEVSGYPGFSLCTYISMP